MSIEVDAIVYKNAQGTKLSKAEKATLDEWRSRMKIEVLDGPEGVVNDVCKDYVRRGMPLG